MEGLDLFLRYQIVYTLFTSWHFSFLIVEHTLFIFHFSVVEYTCVCSGGQRKRHVLHLRSGRDWRRRRIHARSFCVPLLQNVPSFYRIFFCSVKDTTNLYVVYNTFVLEIKQEAIAKRCYSKLSSNGRTCPSPCPLAPCLLCSKGIQFLLVMSHLPPRNLSPGVPVSRPRRALSEPAPRSAKRTRLATTSTWTVHVVLRLARRIAFTACTFCAHTLAGHPCHFAAQHLPCRGARPPDDHFRYSFIVALNFKFIACC